MAMAPELTGSSGTKDTYTRYVPVFTIGPESRKEATF